MLHLGFKPSRTERILSIGGNDVNEFLSFRCSQLFNDKKFFMSGKLIPFPFGERVGDAFSNIFCYNKMQH
jgi:hypothetical protein